MTTTWGLVSLLLDISCHAVIGWMDWPKHVMDVIAASSSPLYKPFKTGPIIEKESFVVHVSQRQRNFKRGFSNQSYNFKVTDLQGDVELSFTKLHLFANVDHVGGRFDTSANRGFGKNLPSTSRELQRSNCPPRHPHHSIFPIPYLQNSCYLWQRTVLQSKLVTQLCTSSFWFE